MSKQISIWCFISNKHVAWNIWWNKSFCFLKNVDVQSLEDAIEKFINAAQRFHSTYDPAPALNLLGHHEFNDQLMELERSFLLPQTR